MIWALSALPAIGPLRLVWLLQPLRSFWPSWSFLLLWAVPTLDALRWLGTFRLLKLSRSWASFRSLDPLWPTVRLRLFQLFRTLGRLHTVGALLPSRQLRPFRRPGTIAALGALLSLPPARTLSLVIAGATLLAGRDAARPISALAVGTRAAITPPPWFIWVLSLSQHHAAASHFSPNFLSLPH